MQIPLPPPLLSSLQIICTSGKTINEVNTHAYIQTNISNSYKCN